MTVVVASDVCVGDGGDVDDGDVIVVVDGVDGVIAVVEGRDRSHRIAVRARASAAVSSASSRLQRQEVGELVLEALVEPGSLGALAHRCPLPLVGTT